MLRLADQQLLLAIELMRGCGNLADARALHTACRHIKKVRALMRLVQPALRGPNRPTHKTLRALTRLLAPSATPKP